MSIQGGMQGAALGSQFGAPGAIIGGVAGLTGMFGGGGEDEAAKQAEANRQAQLAWNKQQDPFSAGGNREQYVPRLNELMQGGYAGVAGDPMFKQLNEQSLSDTQRAMSAKGYNMSGNEMIGLRETSAKNQMSFFDDQYRRLAELSGASRGGGQAAMGQSAQNIYQQGQDSLQSNLNTFSGFMQGLDNIFGDTSNPNMTASNMWNSVGTSGAFQFLKSGG